MQYITPLMENLNSLLYGGGGNNCSSIGEGDYNNCHNGRGNAGCWALGGNGHNCWTGTGNSISNNNCLTAGQG